MQRAATKLFRVAPGTVLEFDSVYDDQEFHSSAEFEKVRVTSRAGKVGEFTRMRVYPNEGSIIDLAIVLEPTDLTVQLGCMGAMHAEITFRGKAAHSARPWQGENALTAAGAFLVGIAAVVRRLAHATLRAVDAVVVVLARVRAESIAARHERDDAQWSRAKQRGQSIARVGARSRPSERCRRSRDSSRRRSR